MKNVNVKVSMNNEGQLVVTGINKDGSASSVQYTVVETAGVREFAKAMVTRGIEKVQKAERSEAVSTEPATTVVETKKEEIKLKKTLSHTKGQMFTNFKKVGTRAVQFNVADKGECTIGFAKDRNVFMEAYAGTIKEITRAEVVRRLSDYEGQDARKLVQMINALKPVSEDAAVCKECKCGVTHKVKEYSVRNYGVALCRNCQTDFGAKYKAERSEAQATCECCELVTGAANLNAEGWCAGCTTEMEKAMEQQHNLNASEAENNGASVVSADGIEDELKLAGVHVGPQVDGVVGLDDEDLAAL